MFASVTTASTFAGSIDQDLLKILSFILFTVTLIASFIVMVLDSERTYKDAFSERAAQMTRLGEEFDQTIES